MRIATVLLAIGLVLILAWLFVWRDLRGWEGYDPNNPATIVATRAGHPNFTIDDCVPGTVYPYAGPTLEEYSGTATVTVLICRSRSSALIVLLSYLAAAGALLFFLRSRRRAAAGD